MKVAKILDKTTLVITGEGVETLNEGSHVLVLAIGPALPESAAPLVVPKCELEVTLVTPEYAIARTIAYQEEQASPMDYITLTQLGQRRTVTKRPQLTIDESLLAGNPAHEPIQMGDPVVLKGQLGTFVQDLASPF